MLVLRLLVMVLTIICLMDGHAEVSSSTTGIRDRRESPAVNTNNSEVEILDRKKKKKPKPSKKKKPKPGKKKKPNNKKPVTTTPTVSTSTLKTTTILTTPTVATTETTTTMTVSPTTTVTTAKTTTSTASATTTLSTTPSATTTATTTTVATSSTASTTTTTIPTTATTSSLPTTAATTADSGAGGECKATNGNPCIFPFKDGNEEYNECKNEGGKYFWCATSVYDSGKYKHWSYCSTDGPCPLEGDGECRAANNKPCVFPFKDGGKEYNECADHSGKYFWCATGTNSAGKYTAWSECPKDGSCPLPQKSTTPVMTPTATAATTTLLTTGTSTAPDQIENKVVISLKDLVKEESKDGTLEMLEAMNKITQTIVDDLKGKSEDNDPKNIEPNHNYGGLTPSSKELFLGYKQDANIGETRIYGQKSVFVSYTVLWLGSIYSVSGESGCCSACKTVSSDSLFFEYYNRLKKCYCFKKLSNKEPQTRYHHSYSTGECGSCSCSCSSFSRGSSTITDFHERKSELTTRLYTAPQYFYTSTQRVQLPGRPYNYFGDFPRRIQQNVPHDWNFLANTNPITWDVARREAMKTFSKMTNLVDFVHPVHYQAVVGHCRIPNSNFPSQNYATPACRLFLENWEDKFTTEDWMSYEIIMLVASDLNYCDWNFLIDISYLTKHPGFINQGEGPIVFMQLHGDGHQFTHDGSQRNDPRNVNYHPHWHIRKALINGNEYQVNKQVVDELKNIFEGNSIFFNKLTTRWDQIGLCPMRLSSTCQGAVFQDSKFVSPTSFADFILHKTGGLELDYKTPAGYNHYLFRRSTSV